MSRALGDLVVPRQVMDALAAFPSGGRDSPMARGAGAVTLGVGAALTLVGLAAAARRPQRPPAAPQVGADGLLSAAAVLAASVAADSALEHYRGGFRNPGMFTPLIASTATLMVALKARRGASPSGASLVFAAAGLVGAAGLGFHIFNVSKRPGRFSWSNLFYAAPLGAPAALSLAGLLGLAAAALQRGRRRLLGLPIGRWLTALVAGGLLGTVGEAGLLHFRGAFQNPFMLLPVTVPPVGAVLLARAAVEPAGRVRRPLTRAWLAGAGLLGLAGVGFHIFGVSRAMGGWRNWRQNLIDGPPIPAPPAFSALALAGLATLRLRDAENAR